MEHRPQLARSGQCGPDPVQGCPIQPNNPNNGQNSTKAWSLSTSFGPNFAMFDPNSTKSGPISTKAGPTSTNVCPALPLLRPSVARLRLVWATLDGLRPEFDKHMRGFGQMRPISARCAPRLGGVRPTSVGFDRSWPDVGWSWLGLVQIWVASAQLAQDWT